MTKEEANNKALEIVNEWMETQPKLLKQYLDASEHYAIICAMREIESNIKLLREARYRKKFQDYELILTELEKM